MLNVMAFQRPLYDRWEIDLAGYALIDQPAAIAHFFRAGLDPRVVVNNWRLSHAYPLNTFQMTLRNRSRRIDPNVGVAQRIKRVDSIESKLRRYADLRLSEIQDIGGCRAILSSVEQVHCVAGLYQENYSEHILDDADDYIKKPKQDGYRSYHLIYRYRNPKHPEYENLKIEIQLRTPLQHAWATAVETVDTFLREGLKSHRGSPKWRRFFALMGGALALRESTRPVPKTPKDADELLDELRHCVEELQVFRQLEAFGRTLRSIPTIRGRFKWVVLELDPGAGGTGAGTYNLRLYGYGAGQLEHAAERLEALERHKAKGVDAVLVSVTGAANLISAYPNYFLDTQQFLEAVRQALS